MWNRNKNKNEGKAMKVISNTFNPHPSNPPIQVLSWRKRNKKEYILILFCVTYIFFVAYTTHLKGEHEDIF